MRSLLMTSALAVVISTTAAAADKIVVEFGYPYPHLFDVTYEKQMPDLITLSNSPPETTSAPDPIFFKTFKI